MTAPAKAPASTGTPGTCSACGCTDDRACRGGCAWANEDHTLCTACITVDRDPRAEFHRSDVQPCVGRGKGLMACGGITFLRVATEQFVLLLPAIRRRHGLEEVFGGGFAGASLAEAMGPGEPLGRRTQRSEVLVCQECSPKLTLWQLVELMSEREPAEGDSGPPIVRVLPDGEPGREG